MAYYLKDKNGKDHEISTDDIFSIASTGKAKRINPKTGNVEDVVFIKPEKGFSFRQKLLSNLYVTPDEIPGGMMGTENLPSENVEGIKEQRIHVDDDWLKGFYARNLSNKGANEDFGDGHIIPTITEIAEEMGRKGAKFITSNPFKKDLKKAKREYDQTGDEGAKKRYEEFKRMSDEWETYLDSTSAPEWSESRLGQIGNFAENLIGDKLDAFDLATAGIPLGTAVAGLAKGGKIATKLGRPGAAVGNKMLGAASRVNEGLDKLAGMKYNPLSARATQDVLTQTGLEGIHGALQTDTDKGEGYLSNALEQGLIAGGLAGLLHFGFGDIGKIANTPENRKILEKMTYMKEHPGMPSEYLKTRPWGVRGEGMDFRPIEMRGKPVLTEDQINALKQAEYNKMALEGDVRIPKEEFDKMLEDVNTYMYSNYATKTGVPSSETKIFEANLTSNRPDAELVVPWKSSVENRMPYPTKEGYSLKDLVALPEEPITHELRVPGKPGNLNLGTEADFRLVNEASSMPVGRTWAWPEEHMAAALRGEKYFPYEYNIGLQNLRDIDELSKMKYSPSLPERKYPGRVFPYLGDVSERRLVGEFGVRPFMENLGLDLLRELIEGKVDEKTEGL